MTQATALIALPRDAYYQVIFTLRDLLPPITASAADIARRDHAAIAQVASLCPANAAQAALAAQYVAANAQAMECLRVTRDPATTPEVAMRCTAQAASMMRQSQGAFRLLLRAQGVKPGRMAAETDGAAWAEHCAEQWMLDALAAGPGDRGRESENPVMSRDVRDHETNSDAPERLSNERDGDGRAEPAAPPVMATDTAPCDARDCVSSGEGPAVDPPPISVSWREASQNPEHPPGNHIRETNPSEAPALGRTAPAHAGHQDARRVPSRDGSRIMGHCPMSRIHETNMAQSEPANPTAMATRLASPEPSGSEPGERSGRGDGLSIRPGKGWPSIR